MTKSSKSIIRQAMSIIGRVKSKKKAAAARRNGKMHKAKAVLTLLILFFPSVCLADLKYEANVGANFCAIELQNKYRIPGSEENIYQMGFCRSFAPCLQKYLFSVGIKTRIIGTWTHQYLITDDDIVIDPTYQQWFSDHDNLPKILIIPKKNLKKKLESFEQKPVWNRQKFCSFELAYQEILKTDIMSKVLAIVGWQWSSPAVPYILTTI